MFDKLKGLFGTKATEQVAAKPGAPKQKKSSIDSSAVLNQLRANEIRKIAALVEADQEANQLKLPHSSILELIRPRLVQLRPERLPTAQRLLCIPFEDMLVSKTTKHNSGRIQRSSLQKIVPLLKEELLAEEWPAFRDKVGKLVIAGKVEEVFSLAQGIWKLAAERLQAMLDQAEDYNSDTDKLKFITRVGGSDVYHDMKLVAGCLIIAEEIERLKDGLPQKPVWDLNDGEITHVLKVYADTLEEHPGFEVFLLLVLLGRLKHPNHIFKVIRHVAVATDDIKIQDTNMGIVGEAVIQDVEEMAQDIVNEVKNTTSDADIGRIMRDYVELFQGVTEDFNIHRDSDWGQRMLQTRRMIGDAMEEEVLQNAEFIVMKALPSTKRKFKGTTEAVIVPNLSQEPDFELLQGAESRLRLIRDCVLVADKVAMRSSTTKAVKTLGDDLTQYIEEIVKQADDLTDPAQNERAEQHLIFTTFLLEFLKSPKEADILFRQASNRLKDAKAKGLRQKAAEEE